MSDSRPVKKLCIVSPCFDEEAAIRSFYDSLKHNLLKISSVQHEIIFVDDGSADGTLDCLNDLARLDENVSVLSLSRNFGHQVALTAGLDFADGDAVVFIDSDLQHPPGLLPDMVRLWRVEGVDVVSTVRRQTKGASFAKEMTSQWFYRTMNLLSDIRIEPGAADFCLLSSRAQHALRQMPERHRFLRGMISWVGFKRVFIEYEAAERVAGASKYTSRKMLGLALDAAFSFSAAPIKIATRLGAFVITLGFIYLAYVVTRAILFGDLAQGWGSLMSVVLIIGGLNFIIVGLIGGYLGRVYEEVKHRPLYFLKQQSKCRAKNSMGSD